MAYTQKPGRGNAPKTGKEIPTPFMRIDLKVKKNTKTREHIGYNPKTG